MGQLTAFGGKPRTIFLNEAESHKLHLAFTVADGVTVKKGFPYKLNADGEIVNVLTDGTDAHQIIGYSIQNGVEGDEVTLAVRGYAVVFARAKTAIVPGAVFFTGPDSVEADFGNYDDTGATAANMTGWAIDPAAALHNVIRVILK